VNALLSGETLFLAGNIALARTAWIRAKKEDSEDMRYILVLMCVACLLLQAVAASAIVKVTATAAGGKIATYSYNWSPGQTSYTLGAPITLQSLDGTVLGKLNSLSCTMGADPFVTLNFGVQAVGATNFFFDTGDFSFASINPTAAFATAGSTLTTDANGGTFTGLFAGGKGYEATYNGGTIFADLNGTFVGPPNTTTAETDRSPAAGDTILGPVSSIRAQWSFNLSDGDGASGTSRFQVKPVPDASTLALAFTGAAPLLAGFALRRRRTA
jgi:hypothetical protein